MVFQVKDPIDFEKKNRKDLSLHILLECLVSLRKSLPEKRQRLSHGKKVYVFSRPVSYSNQVSYRFSVPFNNGMF